jgi:hypothetical protein
VSSFEHVTERIVYWESIVAEAENAPYTRIRELCQENGLPVGRGPQDEAKLRVRVADKARLRLNTLRAEQNRLAGARV